MAFRRPTVRSRSAPRHPKVGPQLHLRRRAVARQVFARRRVGGVPGSPLRVARRLRAELRMRRRLPDQLPEPQVEHHLRQGFPLHPGGLHHLRGYGAHRLHEAFLRRRVRLRRRRNGLGPNPRTSTAPQVRRMTRSHARAPMVSAPNVHCSERECLVRIWFSAGWRCVRSDPMAAPSPRVTPRRGGAPVASPSPGP
jgi:hypothetical protein